MIVDRDNPLWRADGHIVPRYPSKREARNAGRTANSDGYAQARQDRTCFPRRSCTIVATIRLLGRKFNSHCRRDYFRISRAVAPSVQMKGMW